MRKTLFLGTAFLLAVSCQVTKLPLAVNSAASQEYVENARGKKFANYHGVLQSPTTLELEGDGTFIRIERVDLPPSQKSLNKIKNAYMPDGDVYRFENITFPEPNYILMGGRAIGETYATTSLLYELPAPDSTMYAMFFESAYLMDHDRTAEQAKEIAKNGFPEYVITPQNANVIDFAGRSIELGNVCTYAGPHHVKCEGLGEMKWSLFSNAEDANTMAQIQMALTEAQAEQVLQKEEKVKVTFEGKSVTASRLTYKASPQQEGGSDKKITYFMSSTIRGHHTYCELSFYSDEAKANGLSPLASKIIAL